MTMFITLRNSMSKKVKKYPVDTLSEVSQESSVKVASYVKQIVIEKKNETYIHLGPPANNP